MNLWPFLHWCSVHRCSVRGAEGRRSGGKIITHRHTITHDESFTDEKHGRWRWQRGCCVEFGQQDGSSLLMLSLSSLAQGSSSEDKTSTFSVSKPSITVAFFHFPSSITYFTLQMCLLRSHTLQNDGFLREMECSLILKRLFFKKIMSERLKKTFKFCLINNLCWLTHKSYLVSFLCFVEKKAT